MIAIIGATEDDINYISHKLINVREEHVAQIPARIGTFGGREVVVCYTGRGQALAALVTGLIIDRFDPYLVINVGLVSSLNSSMPQGSIFLAERIYNIDVDLSPIGRFKFGQTPGFQPYFISNRDLITRIKDINSRYSNELIKSGILLSTNAFITSVKSLEKTINDNFANMPNIIATDTESAGVATACALYDIPYFSFKTVSYVVGVSSQLVTRVRSGVEKTPLVGSYIMALFNEMDEHKIEE